MKQSKHSVMAAESARRPSVSNILAEMSLHAQPEQQQREEYQRRDYHWNNAINRNNNNNIPSTSNVSSRVSASNNASSVTLTVYVQDPHSFTNISSPKQQRKQSAVYENMQNVKMIVCLDKKTNVERILIELVRSVYGNDFVDTKLGGDLGILETFGLYETEFIPDEEEDLSLFNNSDGVKRVLGSRRPSETFMRQRFLRVLAMDEIPLFVYHNWKFYRPRPSALSKLALQQPSQSSSSANQQPTNRNMHFFIKQLTLTDRALAFREHLDDNMADMANDNDSALSVQNDYAISGQRLIQKYLMMPVEKLEKRLRILDREETREIQEAHERYMKQRSWLLKTLS